MTSLLRSSLLGILSCLVLTSHADNAIYLAANETKALEAKEGQKVTVHGTTKGSGKSSSGTNFVNFEGADFYLALAAATGITEPKRRDDAIAGVLESGMAPPDEIPGLLASLPLPLRADVGSDLVYSRPSKTVADLRQTAEIIDQLGL